MYHLPKVPFAQPVRLGVLISGGGTTLDNFVARIADQSLSAQVALVIASRSDCGGVAKSTAYGFPTLVIDPRDYNNVATFSDAIFHACRQAQVDLVTLAGFLRRIEIPAEFLGRVMNIHPSLIPAFCGAGFYGGKVHQAVYDRGVKLSGCTVHFADNEYDHGPIIVQKSVAVEDADSPSSIAAKVFELECTAYPEAINAFTHAKIQISEDTRRVRVV